MTYEQSRQITSFPNLPGQWDESGVWHCSYYGANIMRFEHGPRYRFYDGSRFQCSDNLSALKAYAKATA